MQLTDQHILNLFEQQNAILQQLANALAGNANLQNHKPKSENSKPKSLRHQIRDDFQQYFHQKHTAQ